MTPATPGDEPDTGEADVGPARAAALPTLEPGDAPGTWRARGRWTVLALGDVAERLANESGPGAGEGPVVVDGSQVEALDTVGALLVARWAAGGAPGAGTPAREVRWQGWSPQQQALLDRVAALADAPAAPPAPAAEGALAYLGRQTLSFLEEALSLLSFLGETAIAFVRELRHPAGFRWRAVMFHIFETGVAALPIVGLLGVLMGIVVTYQGAGQLARYGANIFVVDLLALSMLREFAPLVTAIIVAGRSGSAFAAQLGTMAVTEEIDALRALGLSPVVVLVLPRLLALAIVMPLLTMFADVLGMGGGMVMAALKLGVGFSAFMDRLPLAITGTTLMLGVGKAPVFAAIIAVVGCYQGLHTSGGADSVGTHTTRSVVQSIFLVIAADAVFSVAFSILDL